MSAELNFDADAIRETLRNQRDAHTVPVQSGKPIQPGRYSSFDLSIKVVPRDTMRPEVDGADWYWTHVDGRLTLQVKVCPMSDWRFEMILAMHEAVEAVLCRFRGVTQASVDAFDQEFDKTHGDDIDAGDEPLAPYRREHCFATAVERMLAAEMGVIWSIYDEELRKTYPGPTKRNP